MIGNKKISRNKKGAGFTLMEILVVLAIFSLLVIVIINVFLLSLKSQRQATFRQKTLANLRYVIETMAKQVRTSEINYADYPPDNEIISPTDRLSLINELGQGFEYSLSSGQINLKIDDSGIIEEAILTDLREVWVTKLDFYIDPATDPFIEERCNQDSNCLATSGGCNINDPVSSKVGFCLCSDDVHCAIKNCANDPGIGNICLPFDQQPRVTIVLGFESQAVRPDEQKTIYLQTTISSRVYKR